MWKLSKSVEPKVCVRHGLKVLVCQSVSLARLHHGPQPDRNVHHVNEYDQVSDLLPTYSTILMGCAWHHFSLDICYCCIYNLTDCSSFERVSYHSNYEKEVITETFLYSELSLISPHPLINPFTPDISPLPPP